MTQRTNGSIYVDIKDNIAHIEFGHIASNSFSSEMLDRLTTAFHELQNQPEVHVVLLKSEGERAFCAGASFDELLAVQTLEAGKAFFSGFAKVLNAMRAFDKPILARVHGKSVGGGVGLIAACDYVYATEAASIKLSEIAIGIGPFVIAPAIERKMGKAALAELSLQPKEWKNAYWAQEKGLFSKVFENSYDMDKSLEFHLQDFSQYSVEALKSMKKILWEGTEHWDKLLTERAEISGNLVLTEESKTALSKFKK